MGGSMTLISTESLALRAPFVQLRVSVVELATVGYHGWLGAIGPSEPITEDRPVVPLGDVSWQVVAPVEVQL